MMKRIYKHILGVAAVSVASLGLSEQSEAALSTGDLLDGFKIIAIESTGNGCTGGFSDCYASQNGVNTEGELPSDVIFKYNNGGETSTGNYDTIDGGEFSVAFNDPEPGYLSWDYAQGTGDPDVHYFLIKQARGYTLFYSESARTSWNADITTNLDYQSYSHVTWFNSERHDVPEPAALGLFGIGLAGLGFAARRRRKA